MRAPTSADDTGVDPVKRFDLDQALDSLEHGAKPAPSPADTDAAIQPWPGFDPRTLPQAELPLPQIPPKVQHTVSLVVREAIEAGLSLADTYASVTAILLRHNLAISDDDLSGWVGSHALAVT